AAPRLWALPDRLGPACAPSLLRGDSDWGSEAVMREAERRGQPYLFKLRLRQGVKRGLERAMPGSGWQDGGAGAQGQWGGGGRWDGAGNACCCAGACPKCD